MNWIRLVVISLTINTIFVFTENNSGFGYELIMHILEDMQNSSRYVELHLKSIAAKLDDVITTQSKLEQQSIDHKIATIAKIEQLKDVMDADSNCPENGSNGTYQLKVPYSKPIDVYCEDGWIVIHRRFNGSLDFNQAWVPYREGFGDLRGEHWLGLEKMHQITRSGSYELLVVLKSFDDVVKTAKYDGFKIGSETEQYQLSLGKFAGGDAGDNFKDQPTWKFTTSDTRDNRRSAWIFPCAKFFKSGWWSNACFHANLNGLYKEGYFADCMLWRTFNNNNTCLKEARMMIRAKG